MVAYGRWSLTGPMAKSDVKGGHLRDVPPYCLNNVWNCVFLVKYVVFRFALCST